MERLQLRSLPLWPTFHNVVSREWESIHFWFVRTRVLAFENLV